MNFSARPSNSPRKSSHSIQQLLNAYTIAATAAGVGVVAATQPAEAEVVFTRVHQQIAANTVLNIDLNHDGIVDFQISYKTLRSSFKPAEGAFAFVRGVYGIGAQPSNMVESAQTNGKVFAAALRLRAPIGSAQPFQAGRQTMAHFASWGSSQFNDHSSSGPWLGVSRRYLGFKFLIDGATHYGWARLNVGSYSRSPVLTGYAYETDADKPIAAGQVASLTPASGIENRDVPQRGFSSATLGLLSLGSDGLAVWRRKGLGQ